MKEINSEHRDQIISWILEGKSRQYMLDNSPLSEWYVRCIRRENKHLIGKKSNGRGHSYDLEMILKHVPHCISWTELCVAVGGKRTSSLHTYLRRVCVDNNVDVSHFLTPEKRKSPPPRNSKKKKRTLEEMFESNTTHSTDLRKRLISEGVKEARCERCKKNTWMGEPIPLELDHIDGNHGNNALVNLRILCPNCHALTPTYRRAWHRRKQRT